MIIIIPMYQINVPEYQIKFTKKTSPKVNIPNFGKIPEFYEKNKPDFQGIGTKIDELLKKYFLGKKVAIRVLGSQEHKGKSTNDLIKIIKKLGYDKYNPKRKGDRYENIENKHIDFFALDFKIMKDGQYFQFFLEPFYYWPIQDRKYPVKVDIAIIYDLSKLKRVMHQYKGRTGIKKDGFIFKNPENKKDALLGIIKIL